MVSGEREREREREYHRFRAMEVREKSQEIKEYQTCKWINLSHHN